VNAPTVLSLVTVLEAAADALALLIDTREPYLARVSLTRHLEVIEEDRPPVLVTSVAIMDRCGCLSGVDVVGAEVTVTRSVPCERHSPPPATERDPMDLEPFPPF
jgi:hypothetical protein